MSEAFAPAAAGPLPALELRGLSKTFGPVRAVQDVSFALRAGSAVGIVGENGAGKSTLMNLVYGLQTPEAGSIRVEGREASIASPEDAIRLGIGMVHQHFMLVDTFTAVENLALGAEGGARLGPALARARRALERLSREFGLSVDPDIPVGDLPVGDQQRVEILKALHRGARLLILDEPTAVLTPQEADGLFAVLRDLAGAGVTVVLITHKLREVMVATERVIVMRGGRMVADRVTAETDERELAGLMIGGALPPASGGAAMAAAGQVALRAERIGANNPMRRLPVLDDVDLELRSGEIVGLAGVSGNGQGELLEILAGMRPLDRGRLVVAGREVTPDRPADAGAMRRLGVAHVPEHRHRHGIVAEFTAAETAILGHEGDPGLGRATLDPGLVERRCAGLMERFDVRPPTPGLRSRSFSGGNQQKLVLAREVAAGPAVLLVGQPTRGVDVGAIASIHRELRSLRDRGCAIFVVSAELDELLALADRILVMSRGRVVGELDATAADAATLGLMMSGSSARSPSPP